LYGDGAALLDGVGKEVKDYTPSLKEDILKAFNQVSIIKL
jgi:hypothetical protein